MTETTAPVSTLTPAGIVDQLRAPFPVKLIEVRPGATSGDKTRAIALPYLDSRVIMARLDRLVSVDGWSVHYEPWDPTRLICRLTILGVVKESTGEGAANDPNCGTIAEAQAFKRAAMAFGIARYLWSSPHVWGDYDAQSKGFRDPAGLARRIYELMGLPV